MLRSGTRALRPGLSPDMAFAQVFGGVCLSHRCLCRVGWLDAWLDGAWAERRRSVRCVRGGWREAGWEHAATGNPVPWYEVEERFCATMHSDEGMR